MAYFTLLWKARTIEKYRLKYEREKLNSIRLANSQSTKKTLYQRWCYYNLNTKKRLSKAFLRHYPEGSTVYNFFHYFRADQTFLNFVFKSIIGFAGGIILTYLCFLFFVFQLSISLIHATIVSSIIGVLLTLGLAFSYRVRCLVFLLIPQFFSRVGRYTLTGYALVLILTGPATNTLKNSEVLSESLACGQEQIKTMVRQINESNKKPYISMNDSITILLDNLKEVQLKIQQILIRFHRLVISIAYALQARFSWLVSTVDTCNRKLGTPYQRCTKAIEDSMLECEGTLGPNYAWLCDAAKVIKVACLPVKPLTGFCKAIEYGNRNVLEIVSSRLSSFENRMNSMLYVEVNFHHSYSFNNNSTSSASQVAAGIVTEIRNRADPLLTWLSWSSCVTSLSLLIIIFRAKYYQNMFETRSRFDNRYITKEMRDLDLKRLIQGKETVLPLNRREETKYIKMTSFHLVTSEKAYRSRFFVNMCITTFKLLIHMVADYSLYWVLMTIRQHGRFQTPLQPGEPTASAHVTGSGFLSKIFKSLVSATNAPLETEPPSPVTCLPNPYPPDLQRYSQIGILIFLLWFVALFEPYGLRLRHVIMGHYRPERAKARAVWLYNHIQIARGCFMKFARRKLHREYKYMSEGKHTFRRWLNSHIPYKCLINLLGTSPDAPRCFLCGIMESCNECDGSLVRCKSINCPGTFCVKCFSDIGQLCTICLSPADYGDMSDVSLEKGSSDDSDDDETPDLNDGNDDQGNRPFLKKTVSFNCDNEYTNKETKFSFRNQKYSFSKKRCDNHDEEILVNYCVEERVLSKAMIIKHVKYAHDNRKLNKNDTDYVECTICYQYYNEKHRKTSISVHNAEEKDKNSFVKWKCLKSSDSDNNNRIKNDKKVDNLQNNTDFNKVNTNSRISKQRAYTTLTRRRRLRQIRSRLSTMKTSIASIFPVLKTKRTRPRKRRKKGYTLFSSQNSQTKILQQNDILNETSGYLEYITNKIKIPTTKRYRCKPHRSYRLVKYCGFRYKLIQLLDRLKSSDLAQNFIKDEVKHTKVLNECANDFKQGYVPAMSSKDQKKMDKQKKKRIQETEEKQEQQILPSIETKSTLSRVSKLFSDYCLAYLKNSRISISSIKVVKMFQRKDSSSNALANYKRRKKKKTDDDVEMQTKRPKIESDATRNYRISSFLADQDWIKRRCVKDKTAENENLEPLQEEDYANAKIFPATNSVEVVFQRQKFKLKNKKKVEVSEGCVQAAISEEECGWITDDDSFYSDKESWQIFDEESEEREISRLEYDMPRSLGYFKSLSGQQNFEFEMVSNPFLEPSSSEFGQEKIVFDQQTSTPDANIAGVPGQGECYRVTNTPDPRSERLIKDDSIKAPMNIMEDPKSITMKHQDEQLFYPTEGKSIEEMACLNKKKEKQPRNEKSKAKQSKKHQELDKQLKSKDENKKSPKKDTNKKETKGSAIIKHAKDKKEDDDQDKKVTDVSKKSVRDLVQFPFNKVEKAISKEARRGLVGLSDQLSKVILKTEDMEPISQKNAQKRDQFYKLLYEYDEKERSRCTDEESHERNIWESFKIDDTDKAMKRIESFMCGKDYPITAKFEDNDKKHKKKSKKKHKRKKKDKKEDERDKTKTEKDKTKAEKDKAKAVKDKIKEDQDKTKEVKNKIKEVKDKKKADKNKETDKERPRKEKISKKTVKTPKKDDKAKTRVTSPPCGDRYENARSMDGGRLHHCQKRNPLTCLFTCCFRRKIKQNIVERADEEITAVPSMNVASCQFPTKELWRNQTTQIVRMAESALQYDYEKEIQDEATLAVNKTCTCAVQCYNQTKKCRNVGTYFYGREAKPITRLKEAVAGHSSQICHHESKTRMDNLGVEIESKNNNGVQCELLRNPIRGCDCKTKCGPKIVSPASSSSSISSYSSEYIQETTVCPMECSVDKRGKPYKVNVEVVTKTHRAVETDAKFCDVSTITSDWWTPILERKDKAIGNDRPISYNQGVANTERRQNKHVAVATEEKMVTFKSRAQIIPSLCNSEDILSASRYLIESQKYYNELFTNTVYTPRVSSSSKQSDSDQKSYIQRINAWKPTYKHRTKRFYTPHMTATAQTSNRGDLALGGMTYKTYIDNVCTEEQKKQRNILTRNMKHRCGIYKNRKIPQHYQEFAKLRERRGEINLFPRRCLSNDSISLECHCSNTLTDTGSYIFLRL